MRLFLNLILMLLFPGLIACEQEPARSEPEQKSSSAYSRETLEKIEKDLDQSMQKSLDRVESALESDK